MKQYSLDLSAASGNLPSGWNLNTFGRNDAPNFALKQDDRGSYLGISGGGDPFGNAYISAKVKLEPGTYEFTARFSLSADVNPQQNLLFQCRGKTSDGIFKFYRLENGLAEGRETVTVDADNEEELRIYYRFNPGGEVRLRSLTLTPCEAVKPRWARFACVAGNTTLEQMAQVAAKAAEEKADLLLYPENVVRHDPHGVMKLLSELSARYRMYTSISATFTDPRYGRRYNRGLLYDRQGTLAGEYDKIHPYSPETTDDNVTPGIRTDIFQTDFGKVGIIICYDSWFTDVTQLLALKGAEVILFPVAGYYRSLIPARAADNSVRFVISVREKNDYGLLYGIYDTAGRDVQDPDRDFSVRTSGNTFRDVKTHEVDGIGLLCASLDLNCTVSPHYNGGKMREAPGGKRNRADQVLYLDDMIRAEKDRWWELE